MSTGTSSFFLDADLATATTRGVDRDAAALGGVEAARAAYDARYAAACAIYLAEEAPADRATIVILHTTTPSDRGSRAAQSSDTRSVVGCRICSTE